MAPRWDIRVVDDDDFLLLLLLSCDEASFIIRGSPAPPGILIGMEPLNILLPPSMSASSCFSFAAPFTLSTLRDMMLLQIPIPLKPLQNLVPMLNNALLLKQTSADTAAGEGVSAH